jgi:hypothetical protein
MRYLNALILSLGLGAAASCYTPAAKAGVVVGIDLPVPAVAAPYAYYHPYYARPYWFGADYYGPRWGYHGWYGHRYYGYRGYWGHGDWGHGDWGHWHR